MRSWHLIIVDFKLWQRNGSVSFPHRALKNRLLIRKCLLFHSASVKHLFVLRVLKLYRYLRPSAPELTNSYFSFLYQVRREIPITLFSFFSSRASYREFHKVLCTQSSVSFWLQVNYCMSDNREEIKYGGTTKNYLQVFFKLLTFHSIVSIKLYEFFLSLFNSLFNW